MFQAILNVLAIIVLALVAGFIILLLVDLVLGCIDGKRGVLFFRNRKNTDKDNEILLQYNKDINLNESYYLQNNQKDLALDFDKQYEKENEPEKTNNIDFEKAKEEEKLIEEKNKNEEPATEVNENFTFINKVNPEIEKEIENEGKEEELEPVEELEDEDEDLDFLEDDDDDKSIEEILKAIKERNMRARNQFVKDEEIEPDFEEDEVKEAEEENEAREVEEPAENNEELDKLKAMVEELNKKLEEEQKKNAEIEEKAKAELDNLKKELENKPESQEEITEESLNVLELELSKLIERQKQNEKDLKQNKKEYIPLARIAKTLESDQEKLRRREAIVAKKKMVMHGVNNYVVDEEKEQKLQEDIENLQALSQSVQHCQDVMDANKDRYPILKRTNEILTRNAQELESDISELQARIDHAKSVLNTDNGSDNGTEE